MEFLKVPLPKAKNIKFSSNWPVLFSSRVLRIQACILLLVVQQNIVLCISSIWVSIVRGCFAAQSVNQSTTVCILHARKPWTLYRHKYSPKAIFYQSTYDRQYLRSGLRPNYGITTKSCSYNNAIIIIKVLNIIINNYKVKYNILERIRTIFMILYLKNLIKMIIIAQFVDLILLLLHLMEMGFSHDFKMTFSRKRETDKEQQKAVTLVINKPVLDQYTYIDLQKNTHCKKIKQQVLNSIKKEGNLLNKTEESNEKIRWQSSLDKYMSAKQMIQNRKGSLRNEFQFLKLNKMNKYRKKKKLFENLLPQDIIDKSAIVETFEFNISQDKWKNGRQQRHVKTEDSLLPMLSGGRQSNALNSTPPKDQYQKILNSFLSNYFQKKYPSTKKDKPRLQTKKKQLIKSKKVNLNY